MANTEFLIANGVNYLAKRNHENFPGLIDRAHIFLDTVQIIDDHFDTHLSSTTVLDILESGIIPPELDQFKINIQKFREIYGKLKGVVKQRFISVFANLLYLTKSMRSVQNPTEYLNLTKIEAQLTSSLMHMFLTNKIVTESPFKKALQKAGEIYNRLDNAFDLKKDYNEGVTQVPPTLLNAFTILFS